MPGGGLPFDDWLLLAGNPADAGLHFVGTFDRRITFYSQQVRALRLVHALSRPGNLQTTDHIAVVGAGAAGVTAAIGLALLGNDVMLYDPAGSILQLQSASPRLLHPHIYEWPGLESLDNRAGLPILDWSADTGGGVYPRATPSLRHHRGGEFSPRLSRGRDDEAGRNYALKLTAAGLKATTAVHTEENPSGGAHPQMGDGSTPASAPEVSPELASEDAPDSSAAPPAGGPAFAPRAWSKIAAVIGA